MTKTRVSYVWRSIEEPCGCCSVPASYFNFVYPDGSWGTTDDMYDNDVGTAYNLDDLQALLAHHYGANWADRFEIDLDKCEFY